MECLRRFSFAASDAAVRDRAWLEQILKGYLNYHAIPGNDKSMPWFYADDLSTSANPLELITGDNQFSWRARPALG